MCAEEATSTQLGDIKRSLLPHQYLQSVYEVAQSR